MELAPAVLAVKDAAKYLSLSQARLYELLRTGELQRIKLGHRTVVRRRDADAYIERCAARSSLPTGNIFE